MVIVALAMVVLLGFTALAVDGGALYLARRQAATAADAAALAGALDLPNKDKAFQTVDEYVYENKAEVVSKETPYEYENDKFDSNRIEVICSKHVDFTFAKVLGFDETDVSARAVALKVWEVDAFPLINLNNNYTELEFLEKAYPGGFEVIQEFKHCKIGGGYEFFDNQNPPYFKIIDYQKGITIVNGVSGMLNGGLEKFCKSHLGQTVYVFSLKSSILNSDPPLVTVLDKKGDRQVRNLSTNNSLNQDDVILSDQIVLLKCRLDSFNFPGNNDNNGNNEKNKEDHDNAYIKLTYLNESYDIDELTSDQYPPAIAAKLVE